MLQLRIRWGDLVLHVAHLPPEREVWVGDDRDGPVAFALPMPRTRVVPGTITDGVLAIDAELCPVERVPKGSRKSSGWPAAWALSVLMHALAFGGLSMQPPESLDRDDEALDHAYVAKLVKNAELRETHSDNIFLPPSASGNDLGAAHRGPDGRLGTSTARPRDAHFAIAGPRETTEAKLARVRALIENNQYGAINVLSAVLEGKGPFVGQDDENLGTDARSVIGNLFGATANDAHGPNGLGLSGSGGGGSSKWSGIGIGDVGIFGGCGCGGGGFGAAYGIAFGRAGVGELHKRTAGTVKMPDAGDEVRGELPPEVVRRVVRANFPRLRQCYERGLRSNPSLAGTVTVRFIIDATGAVENVSPAGGTLGDANVQSCVAAVYRTMSFPEPAHGKVMVTYPIDFQPE